MRQLLLPARSLALSLLFITLSPLSHATLLPGDLIISEVMANPDQVSDSYGEWFEIFNASGHAIDLTGLEIRDNGSNSHLLSSPGALLLAAGDYFVLGRSADTSLNGGYHADYVFSSFTLGNSDDEIILQMGAVIIDSLLYDDTSLFGVAGNSATLVGNQFQLTSSHLNYGLGDIGTPGSGDLPLAVAVSVPEPVPVVTFCSASLLLMLWKKRFLTAGLQAHTTPELA